MAKIIPPDPHRPEFDTRDVVLTFGIYAQKHISKVPVRYLIWAINEKVYTSHRYRRGQMEQFWRLAESEIDRRALVSKEYFVTKEAIDFISRLHFNVYLGTRDPNEGVFSWAERMLKVAVDYIDRESDNVAPGPRPGERVVLMGGIRWYVQMEDGAPQLISVGT